MFAELEIFGIFFFNQCTATAWDVWLSKITSCHTPLIRKKNTVLVASCNASHQLKRKQQIKN